MLLFNTLRYRILAIIILVLPFGRVAYAQNVCITSMEKEVLQKINEHRKSKNLPELSLSRTLMITANKNMENLFNKNYTILMPDKFGEYTSENVFIRTSISGTTASDIIRSITIPSEYTKHSTILDNTADYAKNNWKGIGICIRTTTNPQVPTSICIFVGEGAEPAFQADICSSESFIDLTENAYKPPLKHPILRFVAPDQVSVFSTYTDANGKRKKTENGFDVFDKGKRAGVYLNEPNAVFYEVFISTFVPTIVTQEDYVIKIYPKETKDTIFKEVVLKGNSLQEVKAFLDNGGNINGQDDRKYTMLMRAAMRDDAEIVEYLLQKGADVNILSTYFESALTFTKSEKVYDLLMSKNPKTELPLDPGSKYTLMHNFSSNGILKGVKYLLEEKKANIEAKTVKNATPLYHAVSSNHLEIARYLLEKGAQQTIGWETYPIHEAVRNKNIDMMNLLLKYGAKKHINIVSETEFAPIHYAIMENNLEIVKILVENGADVNLKDGYGKTPIGYCDNWSEERGTIRNYLVEKGAKN